MGVNTDDMRAAVCGWRDAESQSRSELYLAVTLCGLVDVAADEIDSLRAEVNELRDEVEALRKPPFVDAGEGWPPKVGQFLRRQQLASSGVIPWPVLTDEIEQEMRDHVGLGARGAIEAERPDPEAP